VLSGEPLRNLVSLGIKLGLRGVESLAGIPGTVGGAIAMNAGTPEGAIGDFLEEIFVVFPGASPLKLKARDLSFSYRKTNLPQEALILQATLRFLRTSPLQVAQAVGEMCRKRAKSQPLRYPSAGCVFKNPPEDSAGRLIDLCGLKGKRHGGAQISTRHANFIINRGGARARDVLELMDMAREAVFKKFAICLEPEVRIVGQG
ncbi:MAG TPA: UDP-N-acetylmuramate dehydrogenase, partial [Thermodesulfatator sp.]|nr:UDP-N-acetylmuramate dehydrogenase [Thermodesulfatator sp.]